jgi:hypothetical protein
MTVSKRTRFEVLRRDEFTCQYCGLKAPEGTTLTIDHVVPVSLGGSDFPDNLVAACRDCNAGKSSIPADAPLVKKVSAHAAAYALGLLAKMGTIRAGLEQERQWIEEFDAEWGGWTYTGTGEKLPLPPDYDRSVVRWRRMGVPVELISHAITTAMNKRGLSGRDAEFSYMAGVIWRTLDENEIDYTLTEETAPTYTASDLKAARMAGYEAGSEKGWSDGFDDGQTFNMSQTKNQDYVAMVVDGTRNSFWEQMGGSSAA